METTDSTRRALEERTKCLEFENHQEGNTEGGSIRVGSRKSSCRRTWSPNDA